MQGPERSEVSLRGAVQAKVMPCGFHVMLGLADAFESSGLQQGFRRAWDSLCVLEESGHWDRVERELFRMLQQRSMWEENNLFNDRLPQSGDAVEGMAAC